MVGASAWASAAEKIPPQRTQRDREEGKIGRLRRFTLSPPAAWWDGAGRCSKRWRWASSGGGACPGRPAATWRGAASSSSGRRAGRARRREYVLDRIPPHKDLADRWPTT